MKKCIIFGNCQCSGIKQFLQFSNFYEKYEVHQYANWQLIQNNDMLIPIHNIKNADLIIYQPLSDVYNCYSTNKYNPTSFFNLLNENCNTISFPRIHNNSIFPIFHKQHSKQDIYGKINNLPNTIEELLYMYDNNLIDFDFNKRFQYNYEIAKEKEINCDIKIIDFLYNNIKNHKLFLTHDHPTSYVFNEVTSLICDNLDLDYNYELGLSQTENITGLEDSVYSSIKNQYPISRYAINYFGFNYIKNEDIESDIFYKNNIIDYYIKRGNL